MDKQLVDNVLKHATTHNRVIEEEACWRQILKQRKRRGGSESASDSDGDRPSSRHLVANERRHSRSPVSEASWKNSSQRSVKSVETSAKQQALDAYERELRHQAKREIELAASQKLPGVVVPNVTMNDRWGHDGWEALQNSNAREPTPAYRPRVQPASYRLAPLVSRTIENPIRSESLSSDLSHKSSVHKKSKSKRRRKSKKRKRRRRDDDSGSDSRSSRSRSASTDASGGGSSDDDVDEKRSSKKKSRRKRRKEKKRRKRYSKRRSRKSRRSRKRYDSSSSRTCTSGSRSRSRSISRSRTRRTSYSSAGGSRSRRSSYSCSCCSRSGSRSGSFSSRSRTTRSRRGSSCSSSGSGSSRSRSSSATSFDSQRAESVSRTTQASREQTSEVKSLPIEPIDTRSIRITVSNGVGNTGQVTNRFATRLPDSDEEARTNVSESDASRRKRAISPTPAHSQCTEQDVREGVVGYASPAEASPRKPASPSSSKSPGAREIPSPVEKGAPPRSSLKSRDSQEPDDLYDPVLAVSDTPSQSPKSSAGHSDEENACTIVEHESDTGEAEQLPARNGCAPPVAALPPLPAPVTCPPPSSIPLPSPRPDKATGSRDYSSWEDTHSVSLSDIIPPPMQRDQQQQQQQHQHQKQQQQPKTSADYEEVPLDSICIPATPPPADVFSGKSSRAQPVRSPPRDCRDCRPEGHTTDRSTPLTMGKSAENAMAQPRYAASDDRTDQTGLPEPASKAVAGGAPSRQFPAVLLNEKGKAKRVRRTDSSPQQSSDRSLSPRVAVSERRNKRNARYSEGSQDEGDVLMSHRDDLTRMGMRDNGRVESAGYPTHITVGQQPVQTNPHPPSGSTYNSGKQRRRKGPDQDAVDSAVRERLPAILTGVRPTPTLSSAREGGLDANVGQDSQEEGEIRSPAEIVTFKRRKRKHGKHHSDQRDLPPQTGLTISPFKLPARQLPSRRQPPPEPSVPVKQPSPTITPTKSRKKTRDRQQVSDSTSHEPLLEANLKDVAGQGDQGKQRNNRRPRNTSPIGLPVPYSVAEAPIEKVSKWQEYGTVAPASMAQTRPVVQPKVTSTMVRPRPPSPAPPGDSDSITEPEIAMPLIRPVLTSVDSAARHKLPADDSTTSKKNEKKQKKEKRRKEKRKDSLAVQPLPAEPQAEPVISRKRSKRRQQILFTEALEAFTQQLLETKRALLPFTNLTQMAYEATTVSTSKQHGKRRAPLPSSHPVPESLIPVKQKWSKKRHHKEATLTGPGEASTSVDPHLLGRPIHPSRDEHLSSGEKAAGRQRPTPQLAKPGLAARDDSDACETDASSDSKSSSSGSGSESGEDRRTPIPPTATRHQKQRPRQPQQHQQQPLSHSYLNGTVEGHRRSQPIVSQAKLVPVRQLPGHRKRKHPVDDWVGVRQPAGLDPASGTGVHSQHRKSARHSPPSAVRSASSASSSSCSSSSSSSCSESSSAASDGISSLQSDEEIAWKETS